MKRWLACLLILTMTAQVFAAPITVMVLPVDGDADEALRTGLTASIEKVVKAGHPDATVKAGTTSFADTAAAVGCDPATPECAESVRKTLSVDELVYGTATNKEGQVEVVVRKKVADKPPEEVIATMAATDPADKVEPAIGPMLGPATPICPDNAAPGPDGKCPDKVAPPKRKRTDRALGIASLIGSGVLLLGGLTLWNEKSKKQDLIDAHPTDTLADFQALEVLEEDAGKDALYGNLLVLGAVAAGALGIYLIRRDRKAQRDAVMVTPAVTPTSAGVWITIGAR